jgi:hypothetical protein
MEKMNLNSKINIALIFIAFLLFLVPSVFFLLKQHYDSMYLVVEKKVIEAAQNCHAEDKCLSSTITLEELINKGYIDKVYDPISKELINTKSYINLDNNEFKVVE